MTPQLHFSPALSLLAAFIMVVVPAFLLLRAQGRSKRNGALAEAPEKTHVDAARGERVWEGTVAYAHASPLAMRVEIDQVGSESVSSGRYSFTWTERNRRVLVAPFYLVLADGTRLRVEPTEAAYLVDALTGKILVNYDQRTKVAELLEGERVWIAGALEPGQDPESRDGNYRSTGLGRVVRAPRGRPLLVSSEPLGAKYTARARLHRRYATGFALLQVASLAVLAPFVDRVLGTSAQGTVVSTSRRTDDDGRTTGYDTVVEGTFGRTTDGLPSELAAGAVVPVHAGRISAQIGEAASLHRGFFVLLLVALSSLWLAYRLAAKRSLPWYRRKLEESGQGRLAENP